MRRLDKVFHRWRGAFPMTGSMAEPRGYSWIAVMVKPDWTACTTERVYGDI